jgi:hypothetical protein
MATYLIRRTVQDTCPHCGRFGETMDVGVKIDGTIVETRACWTCIRQNWSDEQWQDRFALSAGE